MANLSKIKRERMLAFLEELKKEHTDDESIRAFTEIENQLRDKKYGLVWEEYSEHVDEMLEENIPIFTEDKEKEITAAPGEPYNFILEGDNLQSLYLLEKTHRGRIDVIYIDPPYNTGNEDFIYDDNFIDVNDAFRHSKWISFMQERLDIASQLLSNDGVIFISIDDNELAQLKLLCDEILGEENFIAILPRITKKSGKDHADAIASNHDYVVIYTKTRSCAQFVGVQADDMNYPLKDEFFEERGGYKLNQTLDYDSLWYNPAMDFAIEYNGETFYPGGDEMMHNRRHVGNHKAKDWVWRWSQDKFDFGVANGFVVIKNGRGRRRIYTKTYANASISSTRPYRIEYKNRETKLSSIALTENVFSNDNAKKEITKIGLEEFGFPKPTALIIQLLNIIKDPNVVLDFFAGSGTTGQAVIKNNYMHNSKTKFILCTNNENNICQGVTYDRIKRTIFGHNDEDGLPANLKYFKCDWTPRKPEDYLLSNELCLHIKEMIELQNGIEVDNIRNVLILNKEDYQNCVMDDSVYSQIENIWVNQNIIFNSEEMERLNALGFKYIPKEFFGQELREAAE